MTTAEKLYHLIQTLPEEQINEVLQFAEFLQHKKHPSTSSKSIPPSTLTGLRGIAKHKRLRPVGLCAGEFTVPDDFDAPLPEDLLEAFEGK